MINGSLIRGRPGQAPNDPPEDALLHGVRRQDWRARPDAARRLARELAERGEIAYCVVSSETDGGQGERRDQRSGRRQPARLRSAKLLDGAYRFLCEGRICDRSRGGLRLALARDIGLPPRLAVHIDETGEVREARIDLAARADDRNSAGRGGGGRAETKRAICAERTLLRRPRLSRIMRSSSLRSVPNCRAR